MSQRNQISTGFFFVVSVFVFVLPFPVRSKVVRTFYLRKLNSPNTRVRVPEYQDNSSLSLAFSSRSGYRMPPSKGKTVFGSSTKNLIEPTQAQHVCERVQQTVCPELVLNKEINIPQCNSLVRSNRPLSRQHKGSKFITTCLLPLLSQTSAPLFYKYSDTLASWSFLH